MKNLIQKINELPKKFEVKSYNTKTLNLIQNSERVQDLEYLAESLNGTYDTQNKGSSKGQVLVNDFRIIVKPNMESPGMKYEETQVQKINSLIKEQNIKEILNSRNEKVKIQGCRLTNGSPKSDFEFYNSQNEQVLFVSYKDGNSQKSFNGWGGMTNLEHPEIKEFQENIEELYGKEFPKGSSVMREIKDVNLIQKAIYGKDFDLESSGIDNVDFCIQGKPSFKETSKGFKLIGSQETLTKGEIPSGGYEPVLQIRYAKERNNFGISGQRFTINQRDGRKWKEII